VHAGDQLAFEASLGHRSKDFQWAFATCRIEHRRPAGHNARCTSGDTDRELLRTLPRLNCSRITSPLLTTRPVASRFPGVVSAIAIFHRSTLIDRLANEREDLKGPPIPIQM
jgi:hypothetical protein